MNIGDITSVPTIFASDWGGYQHFLDPTIMPFNVLTYPSTNCSVPNRDKIVPDKGKLLIGQEYTQNSGIIGNKEKFVTMGGIECEVRVWPSQQYLNYGSGTGSFDIGETITGGTSGHTAKIISKDSAGATGRLTLGTVSGAFTVGETITGGTSGATGIISVGGEHTTYGDVIEVLYPNPVTGVPQWYQITQNVNPLTRGLHRYSFDDWFDTNLDQALSLNLSRLIWVNGLPQIFSWTGGIGVIASLVANTSLTLAGGVTWASLGFVSPALGGSGNITVNGLLYAITGGWSTDTLTLASTTGISVNDVAFAQIEVDGSSTPGSTFPLDFCRQVKGYMHYGYWKSRKLFQSNAFNRPSLQQIINSQALQNDLVVSQDPGYTGTAFHTYRVTIDSVNPNINTQEFFPGGSGGLNDGRYNISSYSGAVGVTNVYKVVVVGDYTINVNTPAGTYLEGEIVKGVTSNALARVVVIIPSGGDVVLGTVLLSGSFVTGEDVTGQSSAATGKSSSNYAQNYIQYYKNSTLTAINTGSGSAVTVFMITGVITLTDGLTIQFGNFFGHATGDYFKLTINQGGADTFQWQIDGGTPTTLVAITGAAQLLSNGLTISFVSKTGHQIGDFWDIAVSPKVAEAWHNYYYDLPTRRPGQGYVFQLPSNFWTMDTQEDKLYVNTSYGQWSTIDTTLSSDLIGEKVELIPLKQSGALKVIDPWMTGHLEDDLMFVTVDKSLMALGRQLLLQEVQDGYLSDAVKLDFLPCSFVGGAMKYIGKRFYISSPEDRIMHCYDNAKKYWQPPKTFPETGILSIIGDTLIAHSNVRNQTFQMFASPSDNGGTYTVELRLPATPWYSIVKKKRVPLRWNSKFSSNSFVEGYIQGNPTLVLTVYEGVNGCGGINSHTVFPIICIQPDRAPIGEGSLGSHALGSDDIGITGTYFNEIYTKFKPIMQYYFVSLGVKCVSSNQSWSILTLGLNMALGPTGNNTLISPESKIL